MSGLLFACTIILDSIILVFSPNLNSKPSTPRHCLSLGSHFSVLPALMVPLHCMHSSTLLYVQAKVAVVRCPFLLLSEKTFAGMTFFCTLLFYRRKHKQVQTFISVGGM